MTQKTKKQEIKIGPLSFSELLAGKVADGSKTMTRRVVTNITDVSFDGLGYGCKFKLKGIEYGHYSMPEGGFIGRHAPYQVGRLLYVREPHYAYGEWVADGPLRHKKTKWKFQCNDEASVCFEADFAIESNSCRFEGWYKRLARFMPKRYARTFLRVTEVRCERLCDISEADAIAEGGGLDWPVGNIPAYKAAPYTYCFAQLWDSINKKGPKFAENPWVWVVKFERVDMPNPWNSSVDVVKLNESDVGLFTHPLTGLEIDLGLFSFKENGIEKHYWKCWNGAVPIAKSSARWDTKSDTIHDLNRFLRHSILNPHLLQP